MKKILLISSDASCYERLTSIFTHGGDSGDTLKYKLMDIDSDVDKYSSERILTLVRSERPDLVLLDEQDGLGTIIHLREDTAVSNIPIIVLTDGRNWEVEARSLGLGARDCVRKPVEAADETILLHRIEIHLSVASYQSLLEHKVLELSTTIASSLADLIAYRDPNTGGHGFRVRDYMARMGEWLLESGAFFPELTRDELNLMLHAAPLHDIGKIAISDWILLKTSALTPFETETIRRHVIIGAEILEDIYLRTPSLRYLRYASLMAASHHEWYDGNGYPQGLSGNAIPLCARILAVADVYDALTHERVYRSAMSKAEAIEYILAEKGTRFDPLVVAAIHTLQ
jgi:putative two-component system response regulator